MYPISNEAKALFESNAAKVVRITGSTVRILPTDIAVYSGNTLVYQSGDSKRLKLYSGSSEIYDNQGTKTVILYSGDKPIFINDEAGMPIQLNITSSDVRQGDFSIDRYSCNGQMLEIGTAIASEFTLQLDNVEGQFDGVVFEGVELFVEIGISDPADSDAEIIWVPCGYFTCDHQPRRLNTLSITALDRMMRFDKKPASGSLTLPKTVAQLVAAGCSACNVALGQSLSGLPNANYSVTALPDSQDGIIWRDIIRWCAGLMGTNAWIDWNGELRFSWYNNDTGYVSITDNRFSSDLYENPIIITGVKFTDTDEANTTYIAGTEDYAIDISDNGFINADNANALLPNIYLAMNGFAYTPFSASAIAAPYLWPMDRVTFTDKNGKGHVSVLTNVNLSVNGSTDIAAVGESAEFYSYGKSSSFTVQQQATLRRLQRVVGSEINDAVESATAQITGAQGGYVRFMYDANGVMTEILIMNTPDIATATKVWRWNQGGFGYSSNGYQGPFTTAITQDGAIVANFITVGALNASLITTGTLLANIIKAGILSDESGKNFWNMETGEFSLAAATTVGGSTVDSIAQNKANSAVSAFDNSLNQQSVFNRLTNNGQTQGIYLKDGKLYINATYIDTGTLIANIIKGGTLTLGGDNNVNGTLMVKDASGNTIGTWNNDGISIKNGEINCKLTGSRGNDDSIIINDLAGSSAWMAFQTIVTPASNIPRYVRIDSDDGVFAVQDGTGSNNYAAVTYLTGRNLILANRYGYDVTHNLDNYIEVQDLYQDRWTEKPRSCRIRPYSIEVSRTYYDPYGTGDTIKQIFFVDETGMVVSGTKSRSVATDQYSDRLLYCYETPTPMFGDIGDGVISDDGFCYVMLDAVFAQTVTTEQYQVFLQKYGPGDCWVRERKGAYFIVEGTPGLSFGWEIKAKQRDYDQLRLERNDEKFTVPTQTYGEDAAKHINDIQKERIPA